MVEFQLDHTAISHTRIRAKEIPVSPELAEIRRLNPDDPRHFQMARTLDTASPEVLNPYTGDHTPMTNEQLKRWLAEEVYVISPRGSEEPVGYVYLYADDPARLAQIRGLQQIPPESTVTEFNFWAQKDAKPELVESGIRQALARFFAQDQSIPEKPQKPTSNRYALMYVEPDDMDDAVILEKIGARYIGDISYDTPGTTDGPMDRVYLLDAGHFAAAP